MCDFPFWGVMLMKHSNGKTQNPISRNYIKKIKRIKNCILYVTSVSVNLMGTVGLIRKVIQNYKLCVTITIVLVKLMGTVKVSMIISFNTY